MSLVKVLDRESESEAFPYGDSSQLPWGDGFSPPPGASWYPPSSGTRAYGETEYDTGDECGFDNDPFPYHAPSSSAAASGATTSLHTGAPVSDNRSYDTSKGLDFPNGPPNQTNSKAYNSSGWRAADPKSPTTTKSTATSWLASGDKASQLRKSGRKLLPGSESFRASFNNCFASQDVVQCWLAIETSISTFAEVELEPGASLWDLVVLAMSDKSAWATTCQDYISQTWPASSDRIKVLIDRLAQPSARHLEAVNFSGGATEIKEHQTCSNAEDDCPPLKLQADRALLADLVEALAWISAITTETFTIEPQLAQICVWVTSLDLKEPTILIAHDDYSPMKILETSSDCWKRLFPRGMIPGGFPIPRRGDAMTGLELSFDLMCYLCGLEYETSEASGLVLRGHRSLVYPVRRVGDCVQWHFQHLDLTDYSKSQEESIGEHLKNASLEELKGARRHFLGLWAKPEITLGTDHVDNASLTWSNQAEVRETTTKDGVEIGGSIMFPKILSITLNKTYKIANCQRNIYMADFEGKLQSLTNFPVVLYSPIEKRAWLVPYVSILLHLARARAYNQQSIGYHIPACKPAADGGSSAFRTIMKHRRDPVRRTSPGMYHDHQELGTTIQDYVNEVWAALDKVTLETCKARRFFRNQIIGYEAADIAKMKTTLRMKRTDLGMFSNSWTPLLSEIKLALFYEGLFDPILAQPGGIPNTHCGSWLWRQIPKGFDLLTASLPCLIYLSEHLNGSGPTKRLTEDYSWHCPSEVQLLFCDKKTQHVCNRLQELRKNDWRRYNILHPRPEEFIKYPDGAVVFKASVNQATIHESLAAIAGSQEIKKAASHQDRSSVSSTIYGSSRGSNQDWQANNVKRTSHEYNTQGQPKVEAWPSRPSPRSAHIAPAATQLQVWDDPKDHAERGLAELVTDPERPLSDTQVGLGSSTEKAGWAQQVTVSRSRRRRRSYAAHAIPSPNQEHQPPRSNADAPRVEHIYVHSPSSDLDQTTFNERYPAPPRPSEDPYITSSWPRQRDQTQPNSGSYGRGDSRELAVPVTNGGHRGPGSEDSYYDRQPSVTSHTSNDQQQRHRTRLRGGKDRRLPRGEAKKPASSCVFL